MLALLRLQQVRQAGHRHAIGADGVQLVSVDGGLDQGIDVLFLRGVAGHAHAAAAGLGQAAFGGRLRRVALQVSPAAPAPASVRAMAARQVAFSMPIYPGFTSILIPPHDNLDEVESAPGYPMGNENFGTLMP